MNSLNPMCQLINGTVSARSLWAEKMAADGNKPVRCTTHNLFHNWEVLTGEAKREAASRAYAARFDAYVEVTPGHWVLRDVNKSSKKKSSDD